MLEFEIVVRNHLWFFGYIARGACVTWDFSFFRAGSFKMLLVKRTTCLFGNNVLEFEIVVRNHLWFVGYIARGAWRDMGFSFFRAGSFKMLLLQNTTCLFGNNVLEFDIVVRNSGFWFFSKKIMCRKFFFSQKCFYSPKTLGKEEQASTVNARAPVRGKKKRQNRA